MHSYPKLNYSTIILLFCFTANAQFSDSTQVIQTKTGQGFFGWAVSELQDINGDGVMDYIVGSTGSQSTTVFSGVNGDVIHQLTVNGIAVGYAVADAGDVDGDGIHDIIAGNPTNNGSRGIVAVFSGASGNIIWQLNGESTGDRFGASVSSAGDVNVDEKSDILIGAEVSGGKGKVYVYSGANGQIIRSMDAASPQDNFGGGVALLGDIDGDGIADHIVGAHNAGSANSGKAYVYSGATGSPLFTLSPDSGGAVFGQFFVANSGDVNNDGIDDIYVGDYNHSNGAGRAYVFSGSNQAVLHRFSGGSGEGAGPGRSAGDVNNDGYSDIIVGFYTAGNAQAGITKVFSGQNGSLLQQFRHNVASSQLGFDAVGLCDVNGDGRYDFLVSAANGNTVYVLAGVTDRPVDEPPVFVNPGMNGMWFNPDTSGQGIFLDVYPNIERAFLGLFTYDLTAGSSENSAELGHSNHRWLTAFGTISENIIEMDVSLTSGGVFDDPQGVISVPYGTIKITFSDCATGTLEYSFTHIGISGNFPLTRAVGDNIPLCQALSEELSY